MTPKEKEFNLSERIVIGDLSDALLKIEDIKEFIRLLKEDLRKIQIQHNKGHSIRNIYKNTCEEIDKLAGDKLI